MGNRESAQEKQVQQLLERQRAIDDRATSSAELETLRKHRVLIPREFVTIRESVCAATKVPVQDLPFAGELIEVRAEHRDWTGALNDCCINLASQCSCRNVTILPLQIS